MQNILNNLRQKEHTEFFFSENTEVSHTEVSKFKIYLKQISILLFLCGRPESKNFQCQFLQMG